MKRIILILFTVFLVALISCNKERNQSATVIKDCTGTYLRIDSKDYHVCNVEATESFVSEQSIIVTYTKIEGCNNPNSKPTECKLLHINEGWIKVKKIKK